MKLHFYHKPGWACKSDTPIRYDIVLPDDTKITKVWWEDYSFEGFSDYICRVSIKPDFDIPCIQQYKLDGQYILLFRVVKFEEEPELISLNEFNKLFNWDNIWFENFHTNEVAKTFGFAGKDVELHCILHHQDYIKNERLSLRDKDWSPVRSDLAKEDAKYLIKNLSQHLQINNIL